MSFSEKDHTFIICAYKTSPFLVNCIESLLMQTVKGQIIISTSTPNDFIRQAAEKYQLPLVINKYVKGIAADWNYGISQTKTKIITIAHQDDIYTSTYLENALKYINGAKQPLIFFTDYSEIRGSQIVHNNRLLKVKRRMLFPLKFNWWGGSRWMRRRILSLGCPICCPSVTYIRKNLDFPLFLEGYKSDLDWQAWERISKRNGSFLYCPKPLVYHRIHEDSTTSKIINSSDRAEEDYQMFCKFWPRLIARQIEKIYSKSESSNSL